MTAAGNVQTDGLSPVEGEVIQGYGVASGRSADSPYPQGTIAMQRPYFEARGLNLSELFLGTLNVSIKPRVAQVTAPELTFEQVKWSPEHPAETFSFSACVVEVDGTHHSGWIYYPHPETKPMHFQDPATLEVLAPLIAGLTHGSRLRLWLNPQAIRIAG